LTLTRTADCADCAGAVPAASTGMATASIPTQCVMFHLLRVLYMTAETMSQPSPAASSMH
jgi:hypothetical protein